MEREYGSEERASDAGSPDTEASGPLTPAQGKELIAQARAGSKPAQDALLRYFVPVVLDYLGKRVGSRLVRYAGIEDLAQEVLLRGMNGLDHLRAEAQLEDFRAILFRHAQWVLAKRGRQAGEFLGETALGAGDLSEAPIDLGARRHEVESTGPVTREDRSQWMRSLLARLEPKYASALGLYLDGASFAEIAAQLDIEEEAARKRVLRATKMLLPLANPLGGDVRQDPPKAT
jgi:RNA polymerase sigma factor (sigma-70 family)